MRASGGGASIATMQPIRQAERSAAPVPTPAPGPRNPDVTDGDAVAAARVRQAAERNNAAAALLADRRPGEAAELFEQALSVCRSVLGADHPSTLVVAGNLGVAELSAGRRRRGLQLLTAAVAARTRVLGERHPDTLTALNALAAAHRLSGDADTAVTLARLAARGRTEVLGPTHHDTLVSRMGLGLALAGAGDMASAHGVLTPLLSDAETALGADDPGLLALIECGEAHGLLRREI